MKDHRLCTLVDVSTIAADASIKGILNNQTQEQGHDIKIKGAGTQISDISTTDEDYVIPLLLASTSTLVKMAFTYVVGEDKFKGAYAPCYKRESAKADGCNIWIDFLQNTWKRTTQLGVRFRAG